MSTSKSSKILFASVVLKGKELLCRLACEQTLHIVAGALQGKIGMCVIC